MLATIILSLNNNSEATTITTNKNSAAHSFPQASTSKDIEYTNKRINTSSSLSLFPSSFIVVGCLLFDFLKDIVELLRMLLHLFLHKLRFNIRSHHNKSTARLNLRTIKISVYDWLCSLRFAMSSVIACGVCDCVCVMCHP